jgi:hypothetical protein
MSRGRTFRTPTTTHEQAILSSFIHRFFEAPDRSDDRTLIVCQVLSMLSTSDRQWTARSVRLWFKNNRSHYVEPESTVPAVPMNVAGLVPLLYPFPPPQGFPFGYIPMAIEPPPPFEMYLAPAIPLFQPPMVPQPVKQRKANRTEHRPVARAVRDGPTRYHRPGGNPQGAVNPFRLRN